MSDPQRRGETGARAGRPRTFDVDEALDRALTVFWEKGYEGASLSVLTAAMGIRRTSLYAAFGNKEALFRKALGRYLAGPSAALALALDEPDVRNAIEQFLRYSAELLTAPDRPHGCLIVQGALSCSDAAGVIQAELRSHRERTLDTLVERLEQGRRDGQLPAHLDIRSFARYLATVHQGLSIQASSGGQRDDLLSVVQIVISHWPSP